VKTLPPTGPKPELSMRKLFRGPWRLATAPVRGLRHISEFMNAPLEDRGFGDAVADVAQNPSSIIPQIEALRRHLLRMLVAIAVTVGVSLLFTPTSLELLAKPVGGLDQLQAIKITENLGVIMRMGLMLGLALALPYIIFEIWLFVAPGISPRSRWMGLLGIPFAVVLFFVGVAFAYFVMLPVALPFLQGLAGIPSHPTADNYFSFLINIMFWIGIAFEFPLVIFILSSMGFVNPRLLINQWRLAVVVIAVLAAAVTPTVDPVNMSIVMAPLIVLYFVSILFSYFAVAGRKSGKSD
jgi:sec-independent protein translocase protein TatC